MHEAALFYRDYAVKDGGHIRIYPSVSPENTPSGGAGEVQQNATMDFAVMKELLANLLEGIRITGMYAGEEKNFTDLLGAIPPYMINEDGAVKEWMLGEIRDNYAHRHLSHIYPVFPGTEITRDSQPELWEAFKRTVDLRELGAQSGWSFAHMACIWARIGEAERAVGCIDGMAKSVITDSLFTTHNDWRNMGITVNWDGESFIQLDAAFGTVNAVQEMLFRWQKDALCILPALPARLRSGHVRGIVFPEGTADIRWNEEGEITVTVVAERKVDTGLVVKGRDYGRIRLEAGEKKRYVFRQPPDPEL